MSGLSEPRQLLDDICLNIVFFTRLRLPSSDFGGRSLADAIWAAPFAGLAVAVIGALAYAIAAQLGVAPGPASALALAATMLATGCLHEDGLSDIADGFGGGRTREKKLEIMRDSRIGAYGATALGISLLIRWSALSELTNSGEVFLALLAAHAASRGLFGAFMHLLPPARADGLSANAGSVSAETAVIGAALGAAVALLALGPGGAIAALILLGLLFAALRALCLSQIGGQTGDTIGALQQLGEIAVLLVASVCLS
ncbi:MULTISPECIES: adenosylcobinamide-GDP ribazoletransferase [unclassified Mesorhizobium]|uniref:adenosylcobinamide-GDP ribazoletransferase n=1 Tax=unclassified Mesorhizobium TaxID=325217 RepID=UPI000BAEB742|nr:MULTISPECIES: adenosylcobinamide-GDP ribazoletransferase [unclassified Mesorhizobium]TGT58833.1 adenosylcobinamide-GDP ribazoletransferase [Mesorhizobium sp. M00.F.Ca.ET.170.01.1.1]AZO12305.1 adenosylcobinamide-GDP ribazoletransferase [Mesorhizobium sp. M3A.F.Ca.ET.080.04.2.1]PBB83480.1 adenosylcobinamide-GDP ribazoletransferase [Mesorhizobium sp. WSM3876]RWB75020.1 MAG: adenosylcobinamide-GDP ribazoletransferase [Mesorhizobium sp.]RWB89519.1 MAG: adenosylcobinamide-GDP ribazoletransferase 